MKYLDLSFPTPEENLACDEALLDESEDTDSGEVLRFWESPTYFVVAGFSNKIDTEVNTPFCRKKKIPIYRRPSGGGTVLQGPGCLNYALVLRSREPYNGIQSANTAVMKKNQEAIQKISKVPVEVRGITDLAVGGVKFSGNSQRRKRNYFLFHGTFLYAFDKKLIQETLLFPTKVPCYREEREHTAFLMNLETSAEEIKKALKTKWQARQTLADVPHERMRNLIDEKYSQKNWNYKY